jgi:hypothetical protein
LIPAALHVQRSLFCLTIIGCHFLSACLSYYRLPTREAEKWWKDTNSSCQIKYGSCLIRTVLIL